MMTESPTPPEAARDGGAPGAPLPPAALAALREALRSQKAHPAYGKIRIAFRESDRQLMWLDYSLQQWTPTTPQDVMAAFQMRQEKIEREASDAWNFGYVPPAWHEILWEICALRLRFPEEPIEPLVMGANGGGKSWFAAWVTSKCVNLYLRGHVWCFSVDERNSRDIQQKHIYHYLPAHYKTDSGRIKRSAHAALNYNDGGGFTDNKFSLHSGTPCEFRFYGENSNIISLEGVRPWFVWSDEQIPLPWIDSITSRLLYGAQLSNTHLKDWAALLEQKKQNPALLFPVERIPDLMLGGHLLTFTPKGGYTAAVRAFTRGASTLRTVEATLLPKVKHKDPEGRDVEGADQVFEPMPKLQYCADRPGIIYYLHAWDNPIGGNWSGMQKQLGKPGTPRTVILWKAYGVAEGTTDVVFTSFKRAAHVIPDERLPLEGTWYMILDPTDGTRNWAMSWIKINPQGISVIADEWPREGDDIPGVGDPGPWAIPSTGKNRDGDRGPAQGNFKFGFKHYAEEIRRREMELCAEEQALWKAECARCQARGLPAPPQPPSVQGADDPRPRIVVHQMMGHRIMDAHLGNQDNLSHSSCETHIETMEHYQLFFVPSGKASGAAKGTAKVDAGADFVKDLLAYDEVLAVMDEATGIYTFHGQAPKLRVRARCRNHIFALENWTSADGNKGACKDFIDLPRYFAISRPQHHAPRKGSGWVGGGSF